MAVAEASAVWQKTVNRSFYQEDAKRAPKLACCPSSSSNYELIDAGSTSAADGSDHPPVAVMPHNRNLSYTNISPDKRWWLQPQPGYKYQSGLTWEQLSTVDSGAETLISGKFNSTCKFCGADLEKGIGRVSEVIADTADYNFEIYTEGIACDSDVGEAGLKALHGKTSKEVHVCEGMKERYCIEDIDGDKFSTSNHMDELCFHSEASWVVCTKSEPWWRVTGRNELASFVAQKSLDCIENCDLPPPQKYLKGDPSAYVGCAPSPDRKECTNGSSCSTMYIPASTQERGKFKLSGENNLPYNSDKLFSSGPNGNCTTDVQKVFESDCSKAQLLKALFHSQTRAREAEKAAKEACAETERVIKLFFREASQLFVYKQWMQLLKLEAAFARKRHNVEQISDDHLTVLPHIPHEVSKLKMGQKAAKERQEMGCRPSHDITDFAVAFAFGLSLVGAGLILGWTVGWMLRSF